MLKFTAEDAPESGSDNGSTTTTPVKTCSQCFENKPESEFYIRSKCGKRIAKCRTCHAKYRTEASPDQKQRNIAASARWAKNNPDKVLASHMRRTFGLAFDDYQKMLQRQNGLCFICEKPEISTDPRSGKQKRLQVDHCHTTGKIRGLLCYRCNTAIGYLQDDPAAAARLAEYLSKESNSD